MGEAFGIPLFGWGDGLSFRSETGSNPVVTSSFCASGRFLEGERGSNAGSVLTCEVEKQGGKESWPYVHIHSFITSVTVYYSILLPHLLYTYFEYVLPSHLLSLH